MEDVINRSNASHYHWGSCCEGWRLSNDLALSVIEERMPAGTCEERHLHKVAIQVFYVLTGELVLEVDGGRAHLNAGDSLKVLPGAAHNVINEGPSQARFLVISAPTTSGDRYSI